jgi:tetratricopeptide (TPR) repeat protein
MFQGELAKLLRQMKKPREAEAVYQQAIENLDKLVARSPQTVEYRWLRAQFLADCRRYQEAVQAYRELLEKSPNYAKALRELAWLLATCPDARFCDPQKAIPLAQRTVALSPEDGPSWDTLGVAHYRSGDFKAALKALEKGFPRIRCLAKDLMRSL